MLKQTARCAGRDISHCRPPVMNCAGAVRLRLVTVWPPASALRLLSSRAVSSGQVLSLYLRGQSPGVKVRAHVGGKLQKATTAALGTVREEKSAAK